jgi:hypothetical protein
VTSEQAQEMCKILAAEFGISTPRFRFNKTNHGIYYGGVVTIAKPERMWNPRRTPEHSLLHEFTHHLVWRRWLAKEYGFGPPPAAHGDAFKHALWSVVRAWYTDVSLYPWATEYDRVRAYGEKRLEAR